MYTMDVSRRGRFVYQQIQYSRTSWYALYESDRVQPVRTGPGEIIVIDKRK